MSRSVPLCGLAAFLAAPNHPLDICGVMAVQFWDDQTGVIRTNLTPLVAPYAEIGCVAGYGRTVSDHRTTQGSKE